MSDFVAGALVFAGGVVFGAAVYSLTPVVQASLKSVQGANN